MERRLIFKNLLILFIPGAIFSYTKKLPILPLFVFRNTKDLLNQPQFKVL